MIETGKMRVARKNIGGVSKGTIIYKDNIIKRHEKIRNEGKGKNYPQVIRRHFQLLYQK